MSNKIKQNQKILIDARMLGAENAGIGRAIEELVKGLIKLDTANEYHLFLTKENFNKIKNLPDNWHKVLVNVRWYTLKEQFVILKEIGKIKPDFVYFPHFNASLLYRGKFIVTIHDLIWLKYPRPRKEISTLGPFFYFFKNLFSKIIFWSAVKRAQKIIVPTEFTKKEIIGFFHIEPAKIGVINWGAGSKKREIHTVILNEANNLTKKATLRDSQDSPSLLPVAHNYISTDNLLQRCYNINKPYLFYVGSAYPHKNLVFLLNVFKEINLDFQLVLTGKDNYFYRILKKRIKELELDDKIIFTGYVNDEMLNLLYKDSTAFVFPSMVEGFGFPPLEAMAAGAPVVSSNVSCLPEVLGDAALYFNPTDKNDLKISLLTIINNQKLRTELIQSGFKLVKKYSWQKCARKYREIFITD